MAATSANGDDRASVLVALAGNPNSGKTTLFNELTGARQHVGNYPGVTVEKKEGWRRHEGTDYRIVDLPGTYSLTAFTIEERVARQFVVAERPSVVVDVADATNLERSLYLTVQFMELGVPVVLALNMSDLARERGLRIDHEKLSRLLGVPVVRTVASRGRGTEDLLAAVDEAAGRGLKDQAVVTYGAELEEELGKIAEAIDAWSDRPRDWEPRWIALKLLEGDEEVRGLVLDRPGHGPVIDAVERSARHLRTVFGSEPDMVIAEQRYGFIAGLNRECVRSGPPQRVVVSDRIDRVVCNAVLGVPIFVAAMFLLFHVTFTAADAPVEWLGSLKGALSDAVSHLWARGSPSLLRSLLVDGVIEGVGNVIVFLPNVFLLFAAIALLEDSGYMARAAFVMERVMNRIGLHGKSFIPLLLGFGCTVPAIMATRVLESRRDRLTTILVLPLMSCSARLPIYALFAGAFFPVRARGWVTWSLYLVGIALAIGAANLLRRTLLRGEAVPFVMELPPYRVPTFKGTLIHAWERTRLFLRKAGTVIFAASVILWAANTFPRPSHAARDYDAAIGHARDGYIAGLAPLNGRLGLAESDRVVERAAERLLAFDSGQRGQWPDDADASGARTAVATDLLDFSPGAAQARDFLADLSALFLTEDPAASGDGSADVVQQANTRLADAETRGGASLSAAREVIAGREAYHAERTRLRNEQALAAVRHSVAGRIGRGMAVVMRPLGFNWRVSTALIGALAAKELFVSQLAVVYALGESNDGADHARTLETMLRSETYPPGHPQAGRPVYSPLTAYTVMLFCLITVPCVSTIAITVREAGGWRWAALQAIGLFVLAYLVSLIVYQGGRLVGLG